MSYAIELALDAAAAAAIRHLWRELDDAGITYMARSGARPHVSLGVWETVDPSTAEAALTRFASETAPLPLTFASIGLFPGVAVFLAATVTSELLDLHARVHNRSADIGAAPWDHSRPGVWVPHCTLATDLAKDQFEIGLVEFRPVKQLVSRLLGAR